MIIETGSEANASDYRNAMYEEAKKKRKRKKEKFKGMLQVQYSIALSPERPMYRTVYKVT